MLTPLFWKKYFTEYDYLNELIPYQNLLGTICSYAEIRTGDKVLDVGSGTGNLSVKLENEGGLVTAVDFSREGIDIHKTKSTKTNFIHINIVESLPFENGFFDVIVSNNVLYTISRQKRVQIMKELYRILKPTGRIVISNIIEGFNPRAIYMEHLKIMKREKGIIKTILKALRLFRPTIKIIYYNYLISREHYMGEYAFFRPNEQKELLIAAGFRDVSEDKNVYSNQAILNRGTK